MYSDDWHRKRYEIENRIRISGPIYYRHAYDENGNVVGVIVDCEFADDVHIELLAKDWKRFSDVYLNDSEDETVAFREFINASDPESVATLFRFEDALDKAGIVYQKIAFY